jgi:hypothetical protein
MPGADVTAEQNLVKAEGLPHPEGEHVRQLQLLPDVPQPIDAVHGLVGDPREEGRVHGPDAGAADDIRPHEVGVGLGEIPEDVRENADLVGPAGAAAGENDADRARFH